MGRVNLPIWASILALCQVVSASTACRAADESPAADSTASPIQAATASTSATGEQLVRLSKEHEVWIDRTDKTVIVGGQVCLREGALEMFACPKATKEHESVVSVNSKAFMIHAGLLAVGAKPGAAAKFVPDYVPARGDEIDVVVVWEDRLGEKREIRAQEWIRQAGTDNTLEHPWVFVGSQFWTDPNSGKRYYQAESGDMICVSNFATAMMDLPIPSSQANDALLFEAFTERIPPRGTKIKLLLRLKAKTANGDPPKNRASDISQQEPSKGNE